MVANAQMLQYIQPDTSQCMHIHMTECTYILRRICLPWARWQVDTRATETVKNGLMCVLVCAKFILYRLSTDSFRLALDSSSVWDLTKTLIFLFFYFVFIPLLSCHVHHAKNYYQSLTKQFNWRWTYIFFDLGCKISTLWWPLWTVLVRDHLGNPDKDLHRLGDPSASNPDASFSELSFSYKKRFETGLRSRCLPC